MWFLEATNELTSISSPTAPNDITGVRSWSGEAKGFTKMEGLLDEGGKENVDIEGLAVVGDSKSLNDNVAPHAETTSGDKEERKGARLFMIEFAPKPNEIDESLTSDFVNAETDFACEGNILKFSSFGLKKFAVFGPLSSKSTVEKVICP